MLSADDVRAREIPDPVLREPTDAVVQVVRSRVCGSDLHPYHSLPASAEGTTMGHEFIGVVWDVGAEVASLRPGDFVIAPFAWSDNTCEFCREGLHTSCLHGGFWNDQAAGPLGGQAEAVRVPQADGTLVAVPGVGEDSPLLPSLLTLSDVYGTGWHGATDVVAERGDEGIARVLELTGGRGVRKVLEAVGHMPACEQAVGVVRPGGTISRVGVPQYVDGPIGWPFFSKNATLTGGPAPARAYIERLLPGVLDGTVNPGRVFDRTITLDDTPAGYAAMDAREALKVMIALQVTGEVAGVSGHWARRPRTPR